MFDRLAQDATFVRISYPVIGESLKKTFVNFHFIWNFISCRNMFSAAMAAGSQVPTMSSHRGAGFQPLSASAGQGQGPDVNMMLQNQGPTFYNLSSTPPVAQGPGVG